LKACVWFTGHEIADTVARAVAEGLSHGISVHEGMANSGDDLGVIGSYDLHVGYGILRGMAEVFRTAEAAQIPWFNIDRGYWKPSHYDGYYRISCRGTQQAIGLKSIEPEYNRYNALDLHGEKWRGFDKTKPGLIAPATEAVASFFNVSSRTLIMPYAVFDNGWMQMREKGATTPINFADYSYVHTFNSSLGWQALASGIPCVSDRTHSLVGAWSKDVPIDRLAETQDKERINLFATQAALQLTLKEIRSGFIWPLIARLMSISAGTAARP
jgi:hypothetical protein